MDEDRVISIWRSEWGNISALRDHLNEELAYATSNQQKLASRLSKLQGDLTQRVERLSVAFDAFVELSELRDQLGLYVDARRWRVAARQLIETSIGRGPAPADGGAAKLDDVPGYWLARAVVALPDVIEHGPNADNMTEAMRRDARRTSTLLSCVAPLLGTPALAEAHIEEAFAGDPTACLIVAQRVLWKAAIDGMLPASARTTIGCAMAARLTAMDQTQRAGLVAELAARPPTAAATIQPAAPPADQLRQVGGARRLSQWAAWLARCPVGVDEVPAAGFTGAEPADELLAVVRSLVEEGSPPERTLLDRAEHLRNVVSGSTAPLPRAWDDDAGPVTELLLADLHDAAHRARSPFAGGLLTEHIGTAAKQLLDDANAPVAQSTALRTGDTTIEITAAGADPAALDSALARRVESGARSPMLGRFGAVHAGVAAIVVVVFVVAGFAASAAWFALAGVIAVAAGGWWLYDHRREQAAAAQQAQSAAWLRQQVDARVQELASSSAAAQRARTEAAAAFADIQARLARDHRGDDG